MSYLKDAAIGYAKRGLPVLPLRGKVPVTPHGVKDATVDVDDITTWWSNWPTSNIGIATGGGLVVIDVDVKGAEPTGFTTWCQLVSENCVTEPRTYEVDTPSGGMHLYWSSDGAIRNSVSKLAAGVDVRGRGGYVVAPPSPGYELVGDREPLRLPDWLTERLLPRRRAAGRDRGLGPRRGARSSLAYSIELVRRAPVGKRNDTLNRESFIVGKLIGAGRVSSGGAQRELLRAALDVGLDGGEAVATIASGLRAGACGRGYR